MNTVQSKVKLWVGIVATMSLGLAINAPAQHEHHMQQATELDAEGRRMPSGEHNMDQATLDALRDKIELYKEYSDQEIALSMKMMGPNYEWYISDQGLQGENGVLVLAHGFREKGDRAFKDQMDTLSGIFPTAIGFGMSMMMSSHIQSAVDDLVAAGAKRIVVLPAVSSKFNSMMRQWEYIFGLNDEPPYLAVPRVETPARIVMRDPPGDDPLVAEILLDFADELSEEPSGEVVIIVAHGPESEEDNLVTLGVLEGLAEAVRQDSSFSAINFITLQDDAARDVRAANVARLRSWIEDATGDGKQVIIVSNLMATRSIQAKIRKDLKGLDFKFNAKGITQHPNFTKWMHETVRAALETS